MRGLALAVALALPLVGCATAASESSESADERPVSYNRRELPPSPGLFTGKDGVWTIYRSDAEAAPAEPAEVEPPAPKKREILMCDPSRSCGAETSR